MSREFQFHLNLVKKCSLDLANCYLTLAPTSILLDSDISIGLPLKYVPSAGVSGITQLYLRMLFILGPHPLRGVSLSPLPPGGLGEGPGEGPDFHSPKEFCDFPSISAWIREVLQFEFAF